MSPATPDAWTNRISGFLGCRIQAAKARFSGWFSNRVSQ